MTPKKIMKKLTKKLKKFWLETALLVIAFGIAVFSLVLYKKDQNNYENEITTTGVFTSIPQNNSNGILIDLSGSVKNPGLYKALEGDRLKTIIDKGGGLSDTADHEYFARNYNLSRIVYDQEKIHIPSVYEVANGFFVENQQIPFNPSNNTDSATAIGNNPKISLNQATSAELDTLPGVGKTTIEKIMNNRPFKALEELLDKKILNKNVFENIKELIEI